MRLANAGMLLLWAVLLWPGCGNGSGDELAVVLDPEYRLLRDDLPAPGEGGQALIVSPEWGRNFWVADTLPLMAFGSGMRPLGGPVPPGVEGISVTLALDPGARTLQGQAEIDLVAEAELSSVQILLSAAEVDEVLAENPAATFSYGEGVLVVTPEAPVPVGQSWAVTVKWHDQDVEVTTDDFPEWGGEDILVGHLGEPSTFFTFGYWFWPRVVGVDTLSNIEFSVTYPDHLTLVLSGEYKSGSDNQDGTRTEVWSFDRPLSWHVSLALAEYEMVSGACGSTTIEIYGMPLESRYPIVPATYVPVIESICDNFRARFGEPGFGTIRLAGVDERFTNGYSSPALIIVPNYTLDDDGTGSFPARDFYLAHEFSHQWWGNDVFMDSMADAWLTEGLADYSAITYLKDAWGDEQAEYFWLDDAKLLLDYYRQGGRDHPLVPEFSTEMEPVIYYLKGAWVLRMLEWVAGEEILKAALRNYRDTHPFSAATTQDFIDAVESLAGEDLGWFFEQWLYGTGVMSLEESHQRKGSGVEVVVKQTSPWSSDPLSFFTMPLAIGLRFGDKSKSQVVSLDAEESRHQLSLP